MAKRKTIEQLHAEVERKEADMIRAFRAWYKARNRLTQMGARLDKKLAGEAHISQLREARVKPKVGINDVINSMMGNRR